MAVLKGTEKVWISDSYLDTSIVKRLTFLPPVSAQNYNEEIRRFGAIQSKYREGNKLDYSEIPNVAYGLYNDTRFRSLPAFFDISGLFIVSQRFLEVAKGFNVGGTEFSPLRIYQGNRTEEILGPWYFLNIGCRKHVFLPQYSTGSFRPYNSKTIDRWSAEGVKDNEIAVSSAALSGCDLWSDPSLSAAFFISGALEAALKEAKLASTLRRRLCMVMDEN